MDLFYIQNCYLSTCVSNGKYATSMLHELLNIAGGIHKTSPVQYSIALVADSILNWPTALQFCKTYL